MLEQNVLSESPSPREPRVIRQVPGSGSQPPAERCPSSRWQQSQGLGYSDRVTLDNSTQLHFHPLQYLNPVLPNCSLSPGSHWLFEAIPRKEVAGEIIKITVIKCKKLTTKSPLSILHSHDSFMWEIIHLNSAALKASLSAISLLELTFSVAAFQEDSKGNTLGNWFLIKPD